MRESTPVVRTRLALAALTLAGFAIGCNEFISVGVLPQVAAEFSPDTAIAEPDVAAANASIFVWGYALGVVIGAPILGALASRFPVRAFLTTSVAVMAVVTAATAAAPGMLLIVPLRIVSGIPHAAFLGVAAITAATLLGNRHAARGVAVVIGGLTLANMIGAPLGTLVAQNLGWRWCYVATAVLFAVAAAGVFLTVSPAPRIHTSRSPWGGLLNRRMWTLIGVYSLVNAGVFATLTFTAVLTTTHAQMPDSLIALVVAVCGVGMTVGNYLGGMVADRSRPAAAAIGIVGAVSGLLLLAAPGSPLLTIAGFALASFALSELAPFTQTLLMRSTPEDPHLGSSMNSLCANLGSVIGGASAGLAVAAYGAAAAVWVGAVLLGAGLFGAGMMARYRVTDREGRGARRP